MTKNKTDAEPAPAKRQVEVVEETHEDLELLDLSHTPRPEKMAREKAYLKDAHEVHFTERRFIPHKEAEMKDIRAAVDTLTPLTLPLAEPEEHPTVPAPPPEPQEDEPPHAQLTADERSILEGLVPGKILHVETVYRAASGHAVDVAYEDEGSHRMASYVLRDGKAHSLDDIARRIDAMPAPERVEPTAPPKRPAAQTDAGPPAPPVAAEEAPAEKKHRFGFGGKKKAATPVDASDAAPPAAMKSRFSLGRKKPRAEEADEGKGAADEDEPKKRRFGFGRK